MNKAEFEADNDELTLEDVEAITACVDELKLLFKLCDSLHASVDEVLDLSGDIGLRLNISNGAALVLVEHLQQNQGKEQ